MRRTRYTRVNRKKGFLFHLTNIIDKFSNYLESLDDNILSSLIKKVIISVVSLSVFFIAFNFYINANNDKKHIKKKELKVSDSKEQVSSILPVTSVATSVNELSETFYNYLTSDETLVGDGTIGMKYDDYVIGDGENLTTISRKTGANLDTIVSVNKISNANRLRPGQTLKIPNRNGLLYTIKKGESLDDIADRYDVQLDRILVFNKISNPNNINAGDDIFLPGAKYTLDERIDKFGQMFSLPCAVHRISSPYGYRIHPITGIRTMHKGVDIPGGLNTPVYAARKGRVIFAGYSGGYGNLVIVRHDKGYTTYYGHLNKITTYQGASVGVGTIIGRMGSTGTATGSHLHFEVRRNGEALNPADFIPIKKFLRRRK